MSKRRIQTWLALIVVAVGLLLAAILGLWVYMSVTATPLHPNPQDVPSVTRSAPLPKWADAVEQGRQIVRAGLTEQNLPGLSVAVGVGGDIVWAEGFGWADLENRVPVAPDTRFRIGTASTALTSAAVGLLLEKGRLKLDDEIQTYVPAFPEKQWPVTLRQLMGHLAGVRNDGGDEGPLFSEHCERPVEALQYFAEQSAAVRAGDPVPLFELRLDSGERGRRSRRGRAVPHVHAEADLRAAGHGRHDGRLRDRADPGSGDVLLPEVRGGSPLRPGPDAPDSTIPATRDPAYSCPPRPTWCASRWRSTAASCCSPPRSNCSRRHSDWPRGRRRVTVLAGTSRPSRWRVNKRAWSATTATRWAGWWRLS